MWQLLLRQLVKKGLNARVAQQAVKELVSGRHKNAFLSKVQTQFTTTIRNKFKGNELDKVFRGGEYWDWKGAWKRYKQRNQYKSLRNRRRGITWKNIKTGFKTLGWQAIKNQWNFLRNQAKLWSTTANVSGITNNFAQAKSFEKSILTRMMRKEGSVESSAELSSSVVCRGVWFSDPTANSFSGNLHLTFKQEVIRNGRVVNWFPTKTYFYINVSLQVWSLMRAARGREGTGAYSVFLFTHLRGYRGDTTTPPFYQSEQVQNL